MIVRIIASGAFGLLALASIAIPAYAQAPEAKPLPTAAQTDPRVLGMMQGFPPPPDKIIRFADGTSSRFPYTRWAFSHIRELVPTANVSRGEGTSDVPLPRAERDLVECRVHHARRQVDYLQRRARLDLYRRHPCAAQGRDRVREVFRRGRPATAAHCILGDKILRWHSGRYACGRGQARSGSAGDEIRTGTERLRLW